MVILSFSRCNSLRFFRFDFTEVLEANVVKETDGENTPSAETDAEKEKETKASTTTAPPVSRHQQLVSKLHSILRPFLLRRLKTYYFFLLIVFC